MFGSVANAIDADSYEHYGGLEGVRTAPDG